MFPKSAVSGRITFPEEVCQPATYDVYGITTLDKGPRKGENRLKGPGVAADVYGVTQMGGRTSHRSGSRIEHCIYTQTLLDRVTA